MKALPKKILLIGGCIFFLYGCGTSLSKYEDNLESTGDSYAASTYTPYLTSTAVPASEHLLEPTEQPTPTPTVTPTITPIPTTSPTPEPTLTEIPISTETPALTETPVPTETLAPASSPTMEPKPATTPTATPKIEAPASTPATDHTDNSGKDSNGGSGSSNFNTHNNPEQQNTEDTWILNTNSKKIHYPHCKSVPKIAPKNYSTSSESLDELKSKGYTTCGNCFK